MSYSVFLPGYTNYDCISEIQTMGLRRMFKLPETRWLIETYSFNFFNHLLNDRKEGSINEPSSSRKLVVLVVLLVKVKL